MKRPTPEASARAWRAIWYATIDVTFKRSGCASENYDANELDYAVEKKRKVPRSLHQNYCGHGYRQADSVFLHPGVQFFLGPPCDLGGSPAEAAGACRARAMKLIHG